MLNTEPDRIPVAVGLVMDADHRILIGCRTVTDQYFGKWEFPGGKIKEGESASEALKRELLEELGIEIDSSMPFDSFAYDYPDRKVMLYFRRVERYIGRPCGLEQQELRWVRVAELKNFDMLAASKKVIEQLEDLEREACDGARVA